MLGNIKEWYNKRRIYNATYRDLSVLSDRDLKDLGLSRGEIEAISFESAYGDKV